MTAMLVFGVVFICPLYSQEKLLRFNHLTTDDGLSQNTIMGIVKDKYGFMWFGTWRGLNKFDGYKFTIYSADIDNLRTLSSNRVVSVYKDSSENIWVMTVDSVLNRYNYETDDFTRFQKKDLPRSFVRFMNRDLNLSQTKVVSNNYRWDVGVNIVYQTNLKTKTVTSYEENYSDKRSIHSSNVSWLYMDDNQVFWVGGYFYGICYADNLQKPFHYLRTDKQKNKKDIVLDDKIRSLGRDNQGNLWLGTSENGISKYNEHADNVVHFQYDNNDSTNKNRNFFLNQIRSVHCDRLGYIWIGSGAGVRRYDPRNNKTRFYTLPKEFSRHIVSVRSIMEDFQGNLWICTRASLKKYDRKNDIFVSYDLSGQLGSKQLRFRRLFEDKRRNLWIATDFDGLICVRRDTLAYPNEKFNLTRYKYSQQNKNSLGDNCVYHAMEDEHGMIWAGTSAGITRFDPEKGQFTRLSQTNGLSDEFIVGILSDHKGHIWVSHKKGLSRIDTRTFAIRNYSVEDGLVSNEFLENSCYRDPVTGMLYFGSLNGLVYFNPDSIKDNPFLPKIAFTDLRLENLSIKPNQAVNGKVILTQPISLIKELDLPYSGRSFAIEFAALHYSNPKKNRYAYKLEGFDRDWTYTDASMRVAKYSNLSPKSYILRVIASNNDGVWNEKGAYIKINIIAPWWKTRWFNFILISFIIGFLYLAFIIRVAVYKKRQEELALLVNTRTKELEHTNLELIDSQTRIEEYAEEVSEQSESLKLINAQLMEQQTQIEEQTEELKAHSENLKEANDLLIQKQKVIEEQAKTMLEANDNLLKLNATKDKLFSIIAHDLRNPFNSVIGFSELLLSRMTETPLEKSKKYLELIYKVSSSGQDLLENLLQWSRTQTGHIAFEPERISPALTAEKAIDLLYGNALAKNITINQQLDPEVLVYADENMLKTIFRNLISNAIKFSNENGEILLSLSVNNNQVVVSVADFGVGIPEDNIGLLFRIDANMTTKGTANEGGTGLGLLICKEFVELHHGRIWVESTPGKGSNFKFTLPIGRV